MAGGEDTRNHPRRKPTRNLEDPMERLREEHSFTTAYQPNTDSELEEDELPFVFWLNRGKTR